MLKSIVGIIVLSIAVILLMPYAQHATTLLLQLHDWIAETLTQVFSVGTAGDISRKFIALLAPPIIIGLIPSIIYWIARRNWFPYFMHIVWVIWLIEATALVVTANTPATVI